MVLTVSSTSERRTEPVSATPRGDRTNSYVDLARFRPMAQFRRPNCPLAFWNSRTDYLGVRKLVANKIVPVGDCVRNDRAGHLCHTLGEQLNQVISIINFKAKRPTCLIARSCLCPAMHCGAKLPRDPFRLGNKGR
jgi:hypothetical protein